MSRELDTAELQVEAERFDGLSAGMDYTERIKHRNEAFPMNMLVYGNLAVSAAERWEADLTAHQQLGAHLTVLDKVNGEGDVTSSRLHLYVPSTTLPRFMENGREIASVRYRSHLQRKKSPLPATLSLSQMFLVSRQLGTVIFHGEHGEVEAPWSPPMQEYEKSEWFILNQAEIVPLDRVRLPVPRPKHAAHIVKLAVRERRPSGDFPIVSLARPRNLDAITPAYAHGLHRLHERVIERLTVIPKRHRHNSAVRAYYKKPTDDVTQSILDEAVAFAQADYRQLAGQMKNVPPQAVLEDLLRVLKFSVGWLASGRRFKV